MSILYVGKRDMPFWFLVKVRDACKPFGGSVLRYTIENGFPTALVRVPMLPKPFRIQAVPDGSEHIAIDGLDERGEPFRVSVDNPTSDSDGTAVTPPESTHIDLGDFRPLVRG